MMVLPLQKMVEEAQLSPSILQEAFKVYIHTLNTLLLCTYLILSAYSMLLTVYVSYSDQCIQ